MLKLVIVSLILCPAALIAQHSHINAGALSPEAGSALTFVNGSEYSTDSGYVLQFAPQTNGPFAGLYRGSVTFTALAATELAGGPEVGHAQLGAHLELQAVSLTGPAGGVLTFWLEDTESGTAEKLFELPSATESGTNSMVLSENDGAPGSDPYGHIHGRRFTLNQKGLYTVGFRIIETSRNGPDGGPLHPPSEIFQMYFRAGEPEFRIDSITVSSNSVTIQAETPIGNTYQLERTSTVEETETSWSSLGQPHQGSGGIHSFIDQEPLSPGRYYRLRVTSP